VRVLRLLFLYAVLAITASSASPNSVSWPQPRAGTSVRISDPRQLPNRVKFLTLRLCGKSEEGKEFEVEFFNADDQNDFFIVSCSFGIGRTATLYHIVKDKPELTSLAVGTPKEGFQAASEFSSVKVDPTTGKLNVGFETDACGTNGETRYEYAFKQGGYQLTRAYQLDCNWNETATIWAVR
jgi:hypothetical protein